MSKGLKPDRSSEEPKVGGGEERRARGRGIGNGRERVDGK